MLQVTQNYRTGAVEVVDVAAPPLRPGGVIVRLVASLISTGTERGKVRLGRMGFLGKARERPEALRQVLHSLRRDGVRATYRRVMHRLDRLTPLGYSAAGVVEEVGPGVTTLKVGDRVAVGGAGYANHAELVWVPQNLVARIPRNVTFEAAAFATVGSIALHGFRLARTAIGETIAVIGLGLVGQLAVRVAKAAGCRVVGCDLLPGRTELARAAGAAASDPGQCAAIVRQVTQGLGADAVLLTAGSASDGPIRLAAEVARERAHIVAVGALRLDVPREAFYRKELTLVVSRSYGPGRYDHRYEEHGIDYPAAYVRWTEGRNLEAMLGMLGDGALDVVPLVTRRYSIEQAPEAYETLLREETDVLGVVLRYPGLRPPAPLLSQAVAPAHVVTTPISHEVVGIGLVGAGSFASNVLVPALRRAGGVRLAAVSSGTGLSARDAVRKLGFEAVYRDAVEVITHPDVHAVVIATPHHLHAELAVTALNAGKAVLVEKPLAIDLTQLEVVRAAVGPAAPLLVGFNRRFSPHTRRITDRARRRPGALVCHIRVNAGRIAEESWIHDSEIGGGRLVGEGCHFVDLACHIVGTPPLNVRCVGVGGRDPAARFQEDFVITLEFADGSVGNIVYTAKGDPALGKERVEVFCDDWSAVIDDFDTTTVVEGGRRSTWRSNGAKGHHEEVAAFLAALRQDQSMPIPIEDLLWSSAATLLARESLSHGGEAFSI